VKETAKEKDTHHIQESRKEEIINAKKKIEEIELENEILTNIGNMNWSSSQVNSQIYNLTYEDDASNMLMYNKRNWSEEDDQILLHFIATSKNKNWKKISQILKTKTPQQCSYRYNKLIRSENRRKWNRNEDILLLDLFETIGSNWSEISKSMAGRSPFEIQERFEEKLNPNLKRSKFEREEDDKILLLHERYGNQWNEISKSFKDRNAAMIKNRYYSFLKKKILGRDNGQSRDNTGKGSEVVSQSDSNSVSFSLSYGPSKVTAPRNTLTIEKNKINKKRITSKIEERERDSEGSSKEKSSKNISSREDSSYVQFPHEGRKTVSYLDSNLIKNFQEKFLKEERDSEELNNIESDLSTYALMNKAFHNMKFEQDSVGFIGLENENDMFRSWMNNKICVNLEPSVSVGGSADISRRLSDKNSNCDTYYNNAPSKFLSDMMIDDTPKSKGLPDGRFEENYNNFENNYENNFNEHYKNAFISKKNSFEDRGDFINDNTAKLSSYASNGSQRESQGPTPTLSLSSNLDVIDIDHLMKQYQMLEDVFQKVKEVSSHYTILNTNTTDVKTITLNKKLDEKRDNLSLKIKLMKNDYFNYLNANKNLFNLSGDEVNSQIFQNKIRESLIIQIEILMELIKTTRLKISLIGHSSTTATPIDNDKMIEG
jgi:hypothetical protein